MFTTYRALSKHLFYLIGYLFLLPSNLVGQPTNPTVVAGEAIFNHNPAQSTYTVTTTTERTIIDFETFSLDLGELTYIDQPDPLTSIILIRISSNEISTLSGYLFSNASIYFVNPNGVIIGPRGICQATQTLISTLDLSSNQDFLDNTPLTFAGSSLATIDNQGYIEGRGYLTSLIGKFLLNSGTLVSSSGNIEIGAAISVTLDPTTYQLTINPAEPMTPAGTGVTNPGDIVGTHVDILADGPLYTDGIDHSGQIDGKAAMTADGHVILNALGGTTQLNSGSISSIGTHNVGGAIQVLGSFVTLTGQTELITEGLSSGGPIFIGGSMGGLDPTIANAATTLVEPDVVIRASALAQGNGGDVSIFGTTSATFQGTIYTKGGGQSGNGGNVEISQNPTFAGTVIQTALHGETGILTLDPVVMTLMTTREGGSCLSEKELNSALHNSPVVIKSEKIVLEAPLCPKGSYPLRLCGGEGIFFNREAKE